MEQDPLALRLDAALGHHRRGEHARAQVLLGEVLAAAPSHTAALQLAGFLALEQRRVADATHLLSRAVRAGAATADVHLLLGRAQKAGGDIDAAIASYRRAIEIDGDLADAHVSLGVALRATGDTPAAAASYRNAIAVNPASFEAHLNLAGLESVAGDLAAAVTHYAAAERLRPVSGETHFRHGQALWRLGRKSEAADQLERAIARDPDLPEAQLSLGDMLNAMAQHDGALAYHGALLERLDSGTGRPADATTRASLRHEARLGYIDALIGKSRLDEAHAMLESEVRAVGETLPLLERLYWIAPYRCTSQSELVDLCRRLQEFGPSAAQPVARPPRGAEPERLRIGYLSADFREHSVAYFIEPLLACHDRSQFSVVCYYLNDKHDATTARLRSYADEWIDATSLGLRELAERVAADEIDVLVDLSGRTLGSRAAALAFRPAALQLTYLGFPTYTGIDQIDFRVTDSVIDADSDDQGLTSERPLRLPGSMFCYRPPATAPEPAVVAPPSTTVRFGSFNQAPKLSPLTVRLWAVILTRVPGSVLVLKAFAFDEPAARARVIEAFASFGIGADRLEIRPADGAKQDHFAAYRDIDVALDTAPYNGATTTCEALWMGVPVITLAGATHAQRMGASLLGAIGLDELVTHNEEDYVQAAVDLAADTARRAELRTTLRQRFELSSLRDESGFARNFEAAIRQAWRVKQ